MELVIITIIGLCYGSFINVLIFRLPNKISILSPRSFCPKCNTLIPFYRNIPILSFLLQAGKCHQCNNKISIQYPIIEIITAFLWFWFLNECGGIYNSEIIINTVFSILIVSFLIPLAVIDLKYLYFPLTLIILLIIISILKVILDLQIYRNWESLFGMAVSFTFLTSIYLIVKSWFKIKGRTESPMGLGDILLIIPLGIWLEPLGILLCFFISSILALLIWIILYLLKNFSFSEKMPFGPYLIISAILIKLFNLTNLILALISQTK